MHNHMRCSTGSMAAIAKDMPTRRSFNGSNLSSSSAASSSSFSTASSSSLQSHRWENLSIEMEASVQRGADVRYTVRVRHKTLHTRWSLSRSFDEYRAFQKRVLHQLRQGHFCEAECPWMYSFLDGYFPKSSMFRSSSSRVVTQRRDALEKCLLKLHCFLLNRTNHACSVIQGVADEFMTFICGDLDETAMLELANGTTKTSRESSDSVLSSTDDESEVDSLCPLCDLSFAGEDGVACCYTTVLSCGHEFHEECILSKLNESMSCPVCGHAEDSH